MIHPPRASGMLVLEGLREAKVSLALVGGKW